VSRHTAIENASFYHIGKEIKILYNAVPAGSVMTGGSRNNIHIVFAGSLSRIKGVVSLLKAWNIVHKKYPHAVLELFGKGRPEKLSYLLDKKAKDSVLFRGFADAITVNKAFLNARAAVFPSYSECFSIVPLEAMRNGCPVIFTERSSGPELIENGVNGLLVNPDDPICIADAIGSLIADEQLCSSLGEKGRDTVMKRFTINDSAKEHVMFYQNIIDRYNARPDRNG
jgi:glycosyltransferase involved in cell wall biosynthesis